MTSDNRQIQYPRFTWSQSYTWFTVIGSLLAIAIFICPGIVELRPSYRYGIAVGLAACAALIVTISYIVIVIMVFIRRSLHFPVLIRTINGLDEELLSTRSFVETLIRESEGKHAYTIEYCYKYDNRTFIALRKKPGCPLLNGRKIMVIDTQNGSVMGHFQIIEQKNKLYICEKEKGYMAPVWLGYIEQAGASHSEPPPTALAIATSNTRGDENE